MDDLWGDAPEKDKNTTSGAGGSNDLDLGGLFGEGSGSVTTSGGKAPGGSSSAIDDGIFGDDSLTGLFGEPDVRGVGGDSGVRDLFGDIGTPGGTSDSTFGDIFQDDWNSSNQDGGSPTSPDKTGSPSTGSTSGALVPTEDINDLDFPVITVTNRIAAVDLGCKIDIRKLTISLRNCEYNPARATAGTIRWPTDGDSTVVFRVHPKGRLVILCGPMPLDQVKVYAKKCAFLIKKIGHPKVKFRGFKSITILGQFQCDFPIRLETLYADHRDFATYEPELMPGLVYRFPSPTQDNTGATKLKKIPNDAPTIQVYVTGRCIISGCNKEEKMQETVRKLFPVLRQYRS